MSPNFFPPTAGQMIKLFALPALTPLILLNSATALADGNTHQYHIPAQSLNNALMQFAADSNLKLLFAADKVRGLSSDNLDGSMNPAQALSQLLQGSGMTYRFVDAGTVTIEPSSHFRKTAATPDTPEPQSDSGEGQVMPKVTVEADAENAYDPDYYDDPYNKDYYRPNTMTATKTDTPIMDTPVSIQVVPKQVFADQRTTSIKDALENVSGIRSNSNEMFGYAYTIRGFQSFNTFRNNLMSSLAVATVYDTASLDRVEVLKGPGSILYGRIDPGGIINLVTKRPSETGAHSLTQEFGSFDHYRTILDTTGPLTKDNSLLYRVDAAYQNSGSFRDFHGQERVLFHPVLLWRPSHSTELKFEAEYFHHDVQNDIGIPVIGRRPEAIPLSRSFQEPNDPVDETYRTTIGFEFKHDFNDNWTIRNRFHYIDALFQQIDVASTRLLDDNRTLEREISGQELNTDGIYATNLDLVGKLSFLGIDHKLLVGFDYYYEYYDYFGTGGHSGLSATDSFIDIFKPRYSGIGKDTIRSTFERQVKTGKLARAPSETEQNGVYFQDQITLFDKLHILGGSRYDWASVASGCCPASATEAKALLNSGQQSDEQFSPRVGILYRPWTWLGVYGSWSNSFGINNGVSSSGQRQPPEIAEQWEAGFKTELFDQQLTATLAYFDLSRRNILTDDLSTPVLFDTIAVGEASSRGVELDIAGQITDEDSIIASYAYTDAQVTKDNAGFQGNTLQNVPTHSGSIYLAHEFKHYEPLNGLRLGIGAYLVGPRQGDLENTFTLPGYVRLDAFAGYTKRIGKTKLTAQFNIRNLNDKEYYEGNDQFFTVPARLGVFPGAPLTAVGTLRLEF